MISKLNTKFYYITFEIKNYNNFNDIIYIIKLIDKYFIDKKDIIFDTNDIIKYSFQNDFINDYKCTITYKNIFNKNKFIEFIKYKFIFIEKYIKSTNNDFCNNWNIDYKIIEI